MRLYAFALVCACGTEATALLPADYATTYTEVRGCRSSSDHDLHKIRVLADPTALGPYSTRQAAFPAGALLAKEEYDFADSDCSGEIIEWTVMQRSRTATGWYWQRIADDRSVVSEDDERCINCHSTCGIAPDGYEGTCTVP